MSDFKIHDQCPYCEKVFSSNHLQELNDLKLRLSSWQEPDSYINTLRKELQQMKEMIRVAVKIIEIDQPSSHNERIEFLKKAKDI